MNTLLPLALTSVVLLGSWTGAARAQSAPAPRYTISGYVEDAETGEKLIGATVLQARTSGRTSVGTTTNRFGFYSLTLPAGPVELVYAYLGFQPQARTFTLSRDTTMVVALDPASLELEGVEVVGERAERVEETTRMGRIEVPVEQIEALPALLGEVDVLKALQLLPGVQSGTEGTSGLYVRGGGPDQNLILLDGTPVYNASHLFGFFSVFNADAIKNVELSKGGFPARYGGRLSSVVEIDMKEGNMKRFAAQGALGLIASRLTLEGPIVEDKTSFMLSGRRTYIDLLTRPFLAEEEQAGYYFYDLNAKLNHIFSPRDRLFLSVYAGDDRFGVDTREGGDREDFENLTEGGFGWGNVTAALRWNHVLSRKLFANTTLTFTRYRFEVDVEERFRRETRSGPSEDVYVLRYDSGIRDWSARVDLDYLPSPSHYVKLGGGAILHRFAPGASQYRQTEDDVPLADTTIASDDTHAQELMLYAEDDVRLGRRLKVNAGVHLSAMRVGGATYASVQPRLSGRLLVGDRWSLKGSYVTMRQYIHLLTNAGVGLPTDLWVPATERVAPQRAWQAAAGAASSFGSFEVSLEGYYKAMDDLIAYRPGAGFTAPGGDWQDEVLTGGRGTSYGAELFVQRKRGRTSGWLGYTLSWTDRRFSGLGGGRPYPYRYDRRHDVALVLSRRLSRRFDASASWVYGTGNALTLATVRYPTARDPAAVYGGFNGAFYGFYDDGEVEHFGERNAFRMPAYHRLDLGLSYYFSRRPNEHTLALSVYNAYNRKNPFFLDFEADEDGFDPDTGEVRYTRRLIGYALFPVIPSLTYRFQF